MVLTPQLLQAIKLLQMPNAELAAFVEDELERNPMLERAEDSILATRNEPSEAPLMESAEAIPGDWASETLVRKSTIPLTPTERQPLRSVRPAMRGKA